MAVSERFAYSLTVVKHGNLCCYNTLIRFGNLTLSAKKCRWETYKVPCTLARQICSPQICNSNLSKVTIKPKTSTAEWHTGHTEFCWHAVITPALGKTEVLVRSMDIQLWFILCQLRMHKTDNIPITRCCCQLMNIWNSANIANAILFVNTIG